ncbi:hypothetical protein VTN02DRAFT_1574 [Thermoascus thermophilus]
MSVAMTRRCLPFEGRWDLGCFCRPPTRSFALTRSSWILRTQRICLLCNLKHHSYLHFSIGKDLPAGSLFGQRFHVPIGKRKLVSKSLGACPDTFYFVDICSVTPSWSFHSTSHSSAHVIERGRLHRGSPSQAGDVVLKWHLSFFLILAGRSVRAPHALISAAFHFLK